MKRIYFNIEEHGFHGCYWPYNGNSRYCILAQLGDNVDDTLAKTGVRYLHKLGLNVMALSPDEGDYSFHDYPIERFGLALEAARAFENDRFGMMGASTTGMTSLAAASYYPDITLTIALTPSDWIMEGYYRDGLDGAVERPGNGTESTLSWQGKPLPFLPFRLRHPDYWNFVMAENARTGDRCHTRELYNNVTDEFVTEDMKIKVENIKGELVLIAAEDDAMWDAALHVRRMEERLRRLPHESNVTAKVFEHGSHFVFPEGLFRCVMPGIGTLMTWVMFKTNRPWLKEIKKTRMEIDGILTDVIRKWKHK